MLLHNIGKGENHAHCQRSDKDDDEYNPQQILDTAKREGKVRRYTHLIPHGGSNSIGRLWSDYKGMQEKRSKASQTTVDNRTVDIHPEHDDVEKAIYQLMRPSFTIRRAIQDAVREALAHATTENKLISNKPRVMALHPRIEHEMLTHRCARLMQNNLTKVFEHLKSLPKFDLLFIALNKNNVDIEPDPKQRGFSENLKKVANENRKVLKLIRNHGLFGTIPVFESGVDTAAKIWFSSYSLATPLSASTLGVTDLVASVINFFTAVNADIFVGVRGSSYSTDVISARYYQSKDKSGLENYIVGPEGIERIYGPAPPHSCV